MSVFERSYPQRDRKSRILDSTSQFLKSTFESDAARAIKDSTLLKVVFIWVPLIGLIVTILFGLGGFFLNLKNVFIQQEQIAKITRDVGRLDIGLSDVDRNVRDNREGLSTVGRDLSAEAALLQGLVENNRALISNQARARELDQSRTQINLDQVQTRIQGVDDALRELVRELTDAVVRINTTQAEMGVLRQADLTIGQKTDRQADQFTVQAGRLEDIEEGVAGVTARLRGVYFLHQRFEPSPVQNRFSVV